MQMSTDDFEVTFIWRLFGCDGGFCMEQDWDEGDEQDDYLIQVLNDKFYGPGDDHYEVAEEEDYFSMDDMDDVAGEEAYLSRFSGPLDYKLCEEYYGGEDKPTDVYDFCTEKNHDGVYEHDHEGPCVSLKWMLFDLKCKNPKRSHLVDDFALAFYAMI
jgi:hypothetical protein